MVIVITVVIVAQLPTVETVPTIHAGDLGALAVVAVEVEGVHVGCVVVGRRRPTDVDFVPSFRFVSQPHL